MRWLFSFTLFVSTALLFACSHGYEPMQREMDEDLSQADYGEVEGEDQEDYSGSYDAMADEILAEPSASQYAPPPPDTQLTAEELAAQSQRSGRKVHYDAGVRLEGKDPKAIVKRAISIAEAAGGHVAEQTLTTVTLKLPVGRFFRVYGQVLELGKVLHKELTARDLTEQFKSMSLRRKVLNNSLAKFQTLLRTARTAAERLTLMAEIKRLQERIAVLDASLQELAKLAKFSDLKVAAVQQQTNFDRFLLGQAKTFQWVRDLAPYSETVSRSGERFTFKPPKGFVETTQDDDERWAAESASKAVIRTTKIKNNPRGDSGFWTKAIRHHLSFSDYHTTKAKTYGDFKTVIINDDRQPDLTYMVAVHTDDDHISLVETVYPTNKDRKRFHSDVVTALKTAKVK